MNGLLIFCAIGVVVFIIWVLDQVLEGMARIERKLDDLKQPKDN